MGARPHRVTNGCRAAVCALVIAGIRYRAACAILGVPTAEMRRHLPEDWYGKAPARLIDDDEWRRVRVAYEAGREPVDELCKRFGISFKTMYRHAQAAGWKLRRVGRRRNPAAVAHLPRSKRLAYRRMRGAGKSREAALAEIRA